MSHKHYSSLPVGTTGTICHITKARWHNNEVTVAWDGGERNTLGCFVLDKIQGEASK